MVTGEIVLIGSCSGMLYAFDRETGEIRWDYDTDFEDDYTASFHGQPLVRDGAVLIGTDTFDVGFLYSLSVDTGETRWKYQTDAGIAADLLDMGKTIVATTLDDRILGVEFESGRVLWSHTGKSGKTGNRDDEEFAWNTPAGTDGKHVYWGSLDGSVRAIDPAKGKILWRRDLGARVTALLFDDGLYVGTKDKQLRRLDPKDGADLAGIKLPAAAIHQLTPIEGGGLLALVEGAETFVAVDRDLEDELWRAEAIDSWGSFRPLPFKGAILMGDVDGELYAVEPATGRTLWHEQIGGQLRGLGAHGDVLYVGNFEGWVRAWDTSVEVDSEE